MGLGSFVKGIPLVGNLFDNSDQEAMNALHNGVDQFGSLQLPQFQDYKPEDLQYLGDYNPNLAQAKTISEDPGLRSDQLGYLSKLSGLADTGLSDVDQQGYEKARELGDQMARSGSEAAMQNAQARGIAGSGLEFANREIANQEGANRAQQAGLAQAANSAQMRAMYDQAYGQGLSGLRGQDFGVNSANAGILNQFNMANTNAQNQANLRNLDTRQNLSNQNIGQQNYAQQYNNQLKQQSFQDAYQKAGGVSGAWNNMAGGYAAQNAANANQRNSNAQLIMGAVSGMRGGGSSGSSSQPIQPTSAANGVDYNSMQQLPYGYA